jgi:hypothetical protein
MVPVRILLCLLVAFALPLQGWASPTLLCMNPSSKETAMHLQATTGGGKHSMTMEMAAPTPAAGEQAVIDVSSMRGCLAGCCAISGMPRIMTFAALAHPVLAEPLVLIQERSVGVPDKPPRA